MAASLKLKSSGVKAIAAPKSSGPVVSLKLSKLDREFLPAALEILETPASPLGLTLILVICAFFVLAVLLLYFGHVDIVAVAQGKLQPIGRVKTIQALETSRVQRVVVQNGAHVNAGDVLIELDPRDASADQTAAAQNLASYTAEILRRSAGIELARTGATSPLPSIAWPSAIPESVRLNEERVLRSDFAQLAAQVASLQAQADQKKVEQTRLRTMIAIEGNLIDTLQERVNMRSELMSHGTGSKANVLDAVEALQRGKAELARDTGQLTESEANLEVIAKEIQKCFKNFVAENAQKLNEAQRQVNTQTEKLVRADVRNELTILRSPVAGVVQSSSVTTIGQVITPGEELMRIVPDGTGLEIECYLPNKDIGFVRRGQAAVVKLEAFPFTRYGLLDAEVVQVSRDAVPEPEAQATEQNTLRQRGLERGGAAQRVQNLVFPVTLKIERASISVDGVDVPLRPGMAVSVEVRTGSRRIIDYILSPLTQVGAEAMRER